MILGTDEMFDAKPNGIQDRHFQITPINTLKIEYVFPNSAVVNITGFRHYASRRQHGALINIRGAIASVSDGRTGNTSPSEMGHGRTCSSSSPESDRNLEQVDRDYTPCGHTEEPSRVGRCVKG